MTRNRLFHLAFRTWLIVLFAAQSANAQIPVTPHEDPWAQLGGPSLQRFLHAGLNHSPVLTEAAARVRIAEAAAREAAGARLPSATAQVSRNDGRDAGQSRGTPVQWGAGVELQHSLDIWGQARAHTRAARTEVDAASSDYEAARATLARNIVESFAETAEADARLVTLTQNIADAHETVRLTQARIDNGVASTLDMEAANSELERLLIAQADLARARTASRALLATLIGEEPGATADQGSFAEALNTPVPVLPSANMRDLSSRPDLRAVELRALVAGFRIAEARAVLYPELTLTAGVSLTERVFADLFSARSLVTTLVAGLTKPLFDGGRRRARLASAQAEAERIAAEQRTSLLRAAQEVIETQATLDSLANQRAAAVRRLAAQTQVVRLMEERRAAGAASLLDLLRERAALISAREELARLTASHLTAVARALVARGSSPATPAVSSHP
jgi:NodT family efflux transporter outer membrane factor (OMF) lipoprotein